MQPLQRLSAFLRQQLFLISKTASFTSATSLVAPSRTFRTTWIHPGRWEHYNSIRHFYQEWEWPQSACLKALCVPHKHLVSPLPHLFAAVSKHSASSCPLLFGLSLGDAAASGPVLFGIIMAWQVAAKTYLNSYFRHQPRKQSLPLPFSWPTGWKPLKPLLWTSSNLQRRDQIKKTCPSGPFPLSSRAGRMTMFFNLQDWTVKTKPFHQESKSLVGQLELVRTGLSEGCWCHQHPTASTQRRNWKAKPQNQWPFQECFTSVWGMETSPASFRCRGGPVPGWRLSLQGM